MNGTAIPGRIFFYRVSLARRMKNHIPQGWMIPQYWTLKSKLPKHSLKKSSKLRYRKPPCPQGKSYDWRWSACGSRIGKQLRRLNTVLAVFEYMSFAKSWQEKGCCSQAETWQVKNILMNNFSWKVEFDVFVVSMATWTIEYNLKISLLLSLHQIRSLDFPFNLQTAYYN